MLGRRLAEPLAYAGLGLLAPVHEIVRRRRENIGEHRRRKTRTVFAQQHTNNICAARPAQRLFANALEIKPQDYMHRNLGQVSVKTESDRNTCPFTPWRRGRGRWWRRQAGYGPACTTPEPRPAHCCSRAGRGRGRSPAVPSRQRRRAGGRPPCSGYRR
jgi:hypothetical protein